MTDQLQLLERLKLFPGGIAGLSKETLISKPELYRFCAAASGKDPSTKRLTQIASAFRKRVRSLPPEERELGDPNVLAAAWLNARLQALEHQRVLVERNLARLEQEIGR